MYCPQLDDYVDIKGPGAIKRLSKFGIYKNASKKKVNINRLTKWRSYLPVNLEAARPFAKTILKEIKELS